MDDEDDIYERKEMIERAEMAMDDAVAEARADERRKVLEEVAKEAEKWAAFGFAAHLRRIAQESEA